MVRIFLFLPVWTLGAVLCADWLLDGAKVQAPPHPPATAAQAVSDPPMDQIGPVSRIHPAPASYKFPNGQPYVYLAEWRLFNAGTATLRFDTVGTQRRIVATADATGAVALLYHVHDRLESIVDPKTFCSQSLKKSTEEGFRRIETNVRFDYGQKKSILDEKNLKTNSSKRVENDIPSCVTDVISGILYAGTLPLEPGKQFNFPLNDGGKTVDVELKVEERETLKVPAGTYKTLRVQAEATSGSLKGKGKIWLWYSDDDYRIPLQMRARLFWGTLNFKLQRVETNK